MPDTGTADGASLVAVTAVADSALPPEDRIVTFSTTAGGFTTGNGTTASVATDVAGNAIVLLKAPADSTTAIITATANGETRSAAITFRRALPDRIDLVPAALSLRAGLQNDLQLTAYLRRTVGTVSPRLAVAFTAVDTTAAHRPVGAFLPANTVSDVNGEAAARFIVADSTYRGPVLLRASVGGTSITGETQVQIAGP